MTTPIIRNDLSQRMEWGQGSVLSHNILFNTIKDEIRNKVLRRKNGQT